MRVLFVSSEIYPLAKSGGLADVSAALPRALAALGIDVRLVIPGYPRAIEKATGKTTDVEIEDFMGAGPMRLVSGFTPDTGLPVWLVDCPPLFRRAGGLYQDEHRQDWSDNLTRFAVFSHVAANLSIGQYVEDWRADIVHAHDWHAGLVPAILDKFPGRKPATIFTMHNLAYQGLFPAVHYPQLNLPDHLFNADGLEFYGQISLLKAGVRYSDRLTTVSPTYAREILTDECGCGLEGLLRYRAEDLVGILNGADYEVWDPATDPHIAANFSVGATAGKRTCKEALQEEFGLRVDADAPLVVFMSRITHQKMADIVAPLLPEFAQRGAQCILFGDGDPQIEEQFALAARRYPQQIAARTGYEEAVAHRLLAGGDILLHPSRYEPCGLTQLYAMRYGTLPIVRRTGGLNDTVIDAADQELARGTGTGFVFDAATGADLLRCLEGALAQYRQPLSWRRVQRQAMAQNFTWEASARRYLDLYRGMMAGSDVALRPPRPTSYSMARRKAGGLQ